jgi:hypothetical protein
MSFCLLHVLALLLLLPAAQAQPSPAAADGTFVAVAKPQAPIPGYCTLEGLKSRMIWDGGEYSGGLLRARVFQVGKVTLAGLGVGGSEVPAVEAFSDHHVRPGSAGPQKKYCTFYVNEGNDEASVVFDWEYLPKPSGLSTWAYELMTGLTAAEGYHRYYAVHVPRMIACAEDAGYVALGCDGMRHRGPTVFAALLSFSGCPAEQTARTVNAIWGLNGVLAASRLAMIQDAYDQGQADPLLSSRLRALFQGQ